MSVSSYVGMMCTVLVKEREREKRRSFFLIYFC